MHAALRSDLWSHGQPACLQVTECLLPKFNAGNQAAIKLVAGAGGEGSCMLLPTTASWLLQPPQEMLLLQGFAVLLCPHLGSTTACATRPLRQGGRTDRALCGSSSKCSASQQAVSGQPGTQKREAASKIARDWASRVPVEAHAHKVACSSQLTGSQNTNCYTGAVSSPRSSHSSVLPTALAAPSPTHLRAVLKELHPWCTLMFAQNC